MTYQDGWVNALECFLFDCQVPAEGAGLFLIRSLRDLGFDFLQDDRQQVESHPERRLTDQGLRIIVEHLALQRETLTSKRRAGGSACLVFNSKNRSLLITQSVNFPDQEVVNKAARSLLEICRKLYEALRPKWGWIDEPAWELEPILKLLQESRSQSKLRVSALFWTNFWSPEVASERRTMLQEAPGWYVEELPDGGILYVVTEHYREWWEAVPTEVAAYWRKRWPELRIYRPMTSF